MASSGRLRRYFPKAIREPDPKPGDAHEDVTSSHEAGRARTDDHGSIRTFSRGADHDTAAGGKEEADLGDAADDRRGHPALPGPHRQGTDPSGAGAVRQRGTVHLRPRQDELTERVAA